jgi:enoyl-CoA hydratase/carnithine racemase
MAIDYVKEGRIAVFTLNRPEALNAIDPESAEELSKPLSRSDKLFLRKERTW